MKIGLACEVEDIGMGNYSVASKEQIIIINK